MIWYHEIDLTRFIGRMLPIMMEDAEEVFGKDTNINLHHIAGLANLGLIRAFTANDHDEIVGYMAFIISHDLYQAHRVQADCFAMYIKPKNRGREIASKLLKFSELNLHVNRISLGSLGKKSLKNFLLRAGYKVLNEHLGKDL